MSNTGNRTRKKLKSEKEATSWIYEGDKDIASAVGCTKTLVQVSQSPGMHKGPTETGAHHRAVVAQESGTTTLCIRENLSY